jgi:hypothetical protein
MAAGFVLLGLAALPITGCSQLTNQSADEVAASSLSGSSMKVQGTVPAGASTSADAASVPAAPDAQAAAPNVAAAAAVPAPTIPPVTSPTTPALAAAAPLAAVLPPNLGQASPKATAVIASTGPTALNVAGGGSPAVGVASTGTPVLKGLSGSGMQGTAQTLNPVMMRALKQFQVASAAFPGFCRDWAHKLSVREHDNLGNIKWVMHDGSETGNYVGYSPIDSCTCKEASNGVAVGILTYKEFDYTLTGKSVEEAKHATPHATAVVPTREIFAYEKGKWFW